MFALIFQNKVIQIEQNTFPVAPDLIWVECDNSIKVGYDYIDNQFIGAASENTEQKKTRIKNQLISSRKAYLQSTDWYANRFVKRGIAIPQEVIDKNIQAAQEIDDIEAATTLTALNQFNVDFE